MLQSSLTRDHGRDRKGCAKTTVMSRAFLVWAISTICLVQIAFSAFQITDVVEKEEALMILVLVSQDEGQETLRKEECHLVKSFADIRYSADDKFYQVHAQGVTQQVLLTDRFINAALTYYFRVASKEVLKFNSKQLVAKLTVEKDGILLSKGRIIEGMNEYHMCMKFCA